MHHTKFSHQYILINEVLNAVTHGIGLGLSMIGLAILLIKGMRLGSSIHLVSYTIYGTMMIMLFLFSTLFHSLMFTKARKVFQIFDHASIFLLIAGSYIPFCLLSIKGRLGWILIILICLLAIIGIVYKSVMLYKKESIPKASTLIYIAMGWLCIIAFRPLSISLGFWGIFLLVSGGLSYTAGVLFYSLKYVRFMHVVWHLFVIIGTGLVYFSILLFT